MSIKVNIIDKESHLTTGCVSNQELIVENLMDFFPTKFDKIIEIVNREPFGNMIERVHQYILFFSFDNKKMLMFLYDFKDVSVDAAIDIFKEKKSLGWKDGHATKFASLYQEISELPQHDYRPLVVVA